MRILIHVCCGPCAVAVLRGFAASGHETRGFFYNPNIHPLAEYMRRRQGAAQVAARLGVPLIFADTPAAPGRTPTDDAPLPAVDPAPWLRAVLGILENKGDRCLFCLRTRLAACAGQARLLGFDAFSTTLLYSRRQRHDTIRSLGEEVGAASGVAFAYRDFRPFWEEGIGLSKAWGIYRQQYCGCLFSEYERHARGFAALSGGDGTALPPQFARGVLCARDEGDGTALPPQFARGVLCDRDEGDGTALPPQPRTE
jgi:predicted adenine nucleotide alpha hydrolase (AANH) superfamily ATPase